MKLHIFQFQEGIAISQQYPPKTGSNPDYHKQGGETLLTSEMAKAANSIAQNAPEDEDAIVKLGKRTGRTLGFIALPALAWLFGRQLGWW